MLKSSKCYTFLSCLNFAIINSSYCDKVLRPKRVICLEHLFLGRDLLAVLPTGYGKSLIFHVLPALLFWKKLKESDRNTTHGQVNESFDISSIVIVVSPLNSLMKDQICRLSLTGHDFGLRASVLNVKHVTVQEDACEEITCDLDELCEKRKLDNGHYNLVFAHPESLVSCKYGRDLLQSKPYQDNVCAVVVDEAHCILEWGSDFRKDYMHLGVLGAVFHNVPFLALTATANKEDRKRIKESLGLKKCIEVIGNPDRRNIFYAKYFREGQDIDSIEAILRPIAENLLLLATGYPITVIYLPLKWCGFAYKLFESVLGNDQYYPKNSFAIPKNRLFAQFHAPQTNDMKEEILQQLTSPNSTVRVVFATIAMGMGVDIPSIRHIIHIGPPRTIQEFSQETGRAGRDGKPSRAVLYYNNRDIASNKVGLQESVRRYCKSEKSCLRVQLLQFLDADSPKPLNRQHDCCSVCETLCLFSLCQTDSELNNIVTMFVSM